MISPTLRHLALPVGLLVLAACSDSTTSNGQNPTTPVLSRDITLDHLGQAIDSAPQRVEIKLVTGSLVATQVELKTGDELMRPEMLRGGVTAASASGDAGTLTLDLGGLQVGFGAGTELRAADGAMLTSADFVAQIQAALAAGQTPFVRAMRPAPAQPQAPDDASFTATAIRLTDCLVAPKLELNVDGDNFALNDTPPPNASFHVLGLTIEVRDSTDIRGDRDHREDSDVRGWVESVDVADSTVTLTDGRVIVILAETRIEGGEDEDHLGSLDAVSAALAAGDSIKAEAEGVVDSTDATRFLAREIEFERPDREHEGDHQGHDGADLMEFHGGITTASVADGTFTIGDGTLVKLTDATVISDHGDLHTLQALADALAAGTMVRAEGWAVVESAGPPRVLVAAKVMWETEGS